MKTLFLFLIFISCLESSEKTVQAYLVIEDYRAAIDEAKNLILQHPDNPNSYKVLIKALSLAGEEKETFKIWNQYQKKFPDIASQDREVIENMAWGVILKANQSTSPLIRTMASIAGFLSQDAKGVEIIYKNLQDKNSFLRTISIQLAGKLKDQLVREEVYKVFDEDKEAWNVKLEAIKAVGNMKIDKAKPKLLSLIEKENTPIEERMAAIESLVLLTHTVNREEIAKLITSNRWGLRLLACEAVTYLDLKEASDLIVPLLKDSHREVRFKALQTLGLLSVTHLKNQPLVEVVLPLLQDTDHSVAIAAAWILFCQESKVGKIELLKALNSEKKEDQYLAASALALTGKKGIEEVYKAYLLAKDPYVKLNLALALLHEKVHVEEASKSIEKVFLEEKECWAWEEKGIFRFLSPCKREDISEVKNLEARLEILNILSIMKHPHVEKMIEEYLQFKSWGITAGAAALLLTEGNEVAIEKVKNLIYHPNDKISIQAALIVSLWGRDELAIKRLEKAYLTADRDLKERILEGMGSIGSISSIPFLVNCLQEPFQTQRLIAACALLQCLYH